MVVLYSLRIPADLEKLEKAIKCKGFSISSLIITKIMYFVVFLSVVYYIFIGYILETVVNDILSFIIQFIILTSLLSIFYYAFTRNSVYSNLIIEYRIILESFISPDHRTKIRVNVIFKTLRSGIYVNSTLLDSIAGISIGEDEIKFNCGKEKVKIKCKKISFLDSYGAEIISLGHWAKEKDLERAIENLYGVLLEIKEDLKVS
ncbi:MAG: hypothetical protein ACP6IQ_03885 [Candidatus Njordarchaeia archaeon]